MFVQIHGEFTNEFSTFSRDRIFMTKHYIEKKERKKKKRVVLGVNQP